MTGQATLSRTASRVAERSSDREGERRLQRPTNVNMTADGAFSLDKSRIPQGWVMEWKRHTVLGAEDKRNQVLVRQFHWQPVPHKLQPHIYGHMCDEEDRHIVVGGLGLYMRPAYLNDDAEREQMATTNDVLASQLRQLRTDSKAQVGAANTYVKRQTVSVPADTN